MTQSGMRILAFGMIPFVLLGCQKSQTNSGEEIEAPLSYFPDFLIEDGDVEDCLTGDKEILFDPVGSAIREIIAHENPRPAMYYNGTGYYGVWGSIENEGISLTFNDEYIDKNGFRYFNIGDACGELGFYAKERAVRYNIEIFELLQSR